MIYALIGIPLLVFFVYKAQKADKSGDDDTTWLVGTFLLVLILLILFLSMGALYLMGFSDIEEYNELRITIEKHGSRQGQMEDIFGMVVELNQRLRADKMWNDTIFMDPFINDEWAELDPIELRGP